MKPACSQSVSMYVLEGVWITNGEAPVVRRKVVRKMVGQGCSIFIHRHGCSSANVVACLIQRVKQLTTVHKVYQCNDLAGFC
jgi:hypothetical protein